MSISVYFINGLSCPFFVCDGCGERITEPDNAMAAWVGDEVAPVGHYHKEGCLDVIENGKQVSTAELLHHAKMIFDNTFAGSDVSPDLWDSCTDKTQLERLEEA
jgi:hypothetical protein